MAEPIVPEGIGRRDLPSPRTPELARPSPRARTLGAAGLLVMLLLYPLVQVTIGGQNYWLHMLLFTFMYVAMASSWNIVGGYAGYVSLGHNVFFAVGAYFSGLLMAYLRLSPFLTAPAAGLLAMGLGLLVGLISLRTRGPAFIISTIALALLFRIALDNWEEAGGANGLTLPLIGLPAELAKLPFYYAMLLIAVATLWVSWRVKHSKFGLGLQAIAQDETKAEVAGIPTNAYKILAFGISGLFVGMAGAVWAYYLTYLRPAIFLNILVAANLVLMAILGGKGTVAGPVLGAIIFIAANEFFVASLGFTELNIVATGLLMLVVLMFFPEGIVGTLRERKRLPRFLDWD